MSNRWLRLPARLSLITVLCLLLFSCSKIRFAYNQLDWTIPYYAAGFVSLNETQEQIFAREVETFLQWHCSSQIPEYINLFREWQVLANSKQVSYTQMWQYAEQLREFWKALAAQSGKQLAMMALLLTDNQVDEIFENLEEKNQEFKADYVSAASKDIEQELYEHMVDRLELWVDDLQPKQLEWVREWSRQARTWQGARLQVRLNWQASLRQSWRHRVNPDEFQRIFQSLMVKPEQSWPADYADVRAQQRQSIVTLLVNVFNSLNPDQFAFLQNRLDDWVDDLTSLNCIQSTLADLGGDVASSR